MTEIEMAMMHYDGDGSLPYCDLVWEALKEKRDREKATAKGCFVCNKKLNVGLPTLNEKDVKLFLVKEIPLESGRIQELRVELPAVEHCPYCGRKIED